jgi:hypothetical protein
MGPALARTHPRAPASHHAAAPCAAQVEDAPASAEEAAARITALLGVTPGGGGCDASLPPSAAHELVVLHASALADGSPPPQLAPGAPPAGDAAAGQAADAHAVAYLDDVLGRLLSNPDVARETLFVAVAAPPALPGGLVPRAFGAGGAGVPPPPPPPPPPAIHALRPRQSAPPLEPAGDGRDAALQLLVAYFHDGTTRRDAAAAFTEPAVCAHGANGAAPAAALLAEIAFKLGRAPKYGA